MPTGRPEYRIALIFLLVAGLWIVFSDSIVNAWLSDYADQQRFQTYKGLFFVSVVAILLYLLVRRDVQALRKHAQEIEELRRLQSSVLESIRRCMIAIDNDDRITILNGLTARMLRVDVLDARGMRYNDALREPYGAMLPPLVASVRSGSVSYAGIHNDGERIWWHIEVKSLPDGIVIFLEDISDVKNAERERERLRIDLEHALARLSLNIERLPIGYILTDKDFRFHYLNPAAERMFGFSAKELIGRDPYGSIIPYHVKDFVEAVRSEWVKGSTTAHGTNENLRKDGSVIICDWYNTPILNEKGEFLYLISMVQDVTERVRAEEALRLSEARYRSIVEDQTELIARWSPDGECTFVNRAFRVFCGISEEDSIAMRLTSVFPIDEAKQLLEIFARWDTGAVAVAERVTRWTGSDQRFVRWVHRGLFDEDGRLREIQSVGRDITEQRIAEELLRSSEERLRTLFESATEGILTIERGIFTSCNPCAAEMLGMPSQRIVGRTPEQLSPEYQHDGRRSEEHVRENLARALSGEPLTFEWVHSRADGSEVIMEISLGASGPQHRATLLCFWRDITERKRAEDELLRSREELLRSREELRALTARLDAVREQEQLALSRELHDGLGQILTAMKIDTALLKRILDARSAETEGRDIVVSLDELTDSALRMSRDLARSIRPVMLEEIGLAQALQRLVMETAQRGQLAQSVRVDCDVSKLPHAHALALYRIAQEACTNILRHARASELRTHLFETANMIGLMISDNGQGMVMSNQEHGTSLGLVGMRERAAQLGGTVHIVSEPQRGTRVTATLPKPDSPSAAEQEHNGPDTKRSE